MSPLEWSERLVNIPENGLQRSKTATAAEREAVATELGVVSCGELSCRYEIQPIPGNRFRVSGTISAATVQTCVVTLDPVDQKMELDLDVEFWPNVQIDQLAEEFDEPDREDPEPIIGGELDIGRVIYELIAASLDPYPRAPGAELERNSSGAGEATGNNPFAALSRLRQDQNDG